MASGQPGQTKMHTDNKSEDNPSSENQSEARILYDGTPINQSERCLYQERIAIIQSERFLSDERTPSNQTEGCLYDERTPIDQSEERFSNPCKRKRVPSTEYLDAIDKSDDFNNYFESHEHLKTEKNASHTSSSFFNAGPSSAEKSAQVQSSSELPERLTFMERSSLAQGSSHTELSGQRQTLCVERSTLYTLTSPSGSSKSSSPSERSRSLGINSSHLACQENDLDCKSIDDVASECTYSISETSEKFENSGFGSDSKTCDTRTDNDISHLLHVSSQNMSQGDEETGEISYSSSSLRESLPSGEYVSNQSAYSDMDTTSTSGTNQNDLHAVTANSCLSSSLSSTSAGSSFSISSSTTSFSLSSATTDSSSKPVSLSISKEVSNSIAETEASSSSISASTTQSPKQKFSISMMSSTSQTKRPIFPRDFPQPEIVSEPMKEFPGVVVNTYSFEIPVKKETSNTDSLASSTSCQDEIDKASPAFNFNIPSYLLIQIFQHLSMYELLHNVSSVCKLWYTVSHDPDLWRVIDLRNQLKVTDIVIANLTSYSDRVIYLNLSDIGTISEDCLVQTVTTCSHLKTLILSRCMSVMTDKVLAAIGGHCHNLRKINMEVCYRITDKGIEAMVVGCPRLEGVHISQCQNITNKGLASLGEHCPNLRNLSVDSCVKVEDDGIMAIADGCPELRVINLHSSSVGDAGAYHLQKLKFLQTLDLSGSNELSLRTICAITQNCLQLECLNLSLNRNVDDSCIEMVARHCRNLKKLYCVSCTVTDTGLEYLGRYSKNLEHLDIGWCHSVTDAGVQFVSEHCQSLRYIGLIRCDQVTADGIEELVDKFPRINYSTFILESRKIIAMARMQGFQFPGNSDNEKPNFLF